MGFLSNYIIKQKFNLTIVINLTITKVTLLNLHCYYYPIKNGLNHYD